MQTNRRNFVGAAIVALTAGGTVAATQAEAAMAGINFGASDLGLFAWIVERFGAANTVAAIVRLSAEGRFDLTTLKRELGRDLRQRKRHEAAARRRVAHAGDEVLYRGPVRLHQQFRGRTVRSEMHRRRVLVGETDRVYSITGIGATAAAVTIPRRSRVLIDLRHGLRDVMVCEVVRTRRGDVRLHLWLTQQDRDTEDCPMLRGGVVWESDATVERVTGLLGLPL